MNRKQIICLILGFLGAAIIAVIILVGRNATPDGGNQPEPGSPSPSPGITVEPPSVNPTPVPNPSENNGDNDDEPDLIIDVTGDPQPSPGNIGGSSGNGGGDNKPKEPTKPMEPSKPGSGPDGGNNGGTDIGKEPDPYQYKCAEHKCDTPEKHAYIQTLEIEGCSICGSHSCPSFYALNQWGYTQYTPSKCPKYDVVNDPVYFCQDCGKPAGDGMNNTCARFVKAVNCPNCGAYVQGWTCHGCEIREGDYEN